MAKAKPPAKNAERNAGRKNLRPPWTKDTHPRGGRPKGSISIKARLREALETPSREGEKPPVQRAVEVVSRKAAKNADFALRAFDYIDPRTHVIEADVDVSRLEDRLFDRFFSLATESETEGDIHETSGNGDGRRLPPSAPGSGNGEL